MRYAVTHSLPTTTGQSFVNRPGYSRGGHFWRRSRRRAGQGRRCDRDGHNGRDGRSRNVPAPQAVGADYVTLPALSSAKIELYQAMRADGVGKAALAKRLGVALPQVDRLIDLKHSSRLDAIERAFLALGRSMTIVVKAAA